MTNLLKINFENNNVRFVDHPEEVFDFGIVAKDLALVLEYSANTQGTQALSRNVDEEYKGVANVATASGTQSMSVIWEPGIYQVLARTNKPKAKPFQKELYEKILPQIRKTGGYKEFKEPDLQERYLAIVNDEHMSDDDKKLNQKGE
jgi:anti-repressor protein